MKKYYIFVLMLLFTVILNVNAETVNKIRTTTNNLNVRTGPGTNYDSIRTLAVDSTYELVSKELIKNEKGCSNGWYRIYYTGTQIGYVCSTYTEVFTEEKEDYVTNGECEADLKNKGFPQSYVEPLCKLKDKYPTWNFIADKTGLSFPTAVSKESVVGKSLIQSSNQGYLSTDVSSYDYLTDKFTVKEGSNWYAASSDVVAYYMDPRNFFDERYIFMFEKLSFDASYQTQSAVNGVLSDRDIEEYISVILDAAQKNNINAIYLASKIRQETGGNYSNYSLAGNSVTYNGKTYSHVYNPYNIGANSGAADGLRWAVSGTSYLRPWTTRETAIRGGASHIAETYISKGQDSIYFQKFNTSSYSSYSSYAHQYMTNIRGASSEASIAHDGYQSIDLLSKTNFLFVIPVYDDMKTSNYSLPNPNNPNNHLKDLKINGATISGFSHDKYEYNFYVPNGVTSIKIDATVINSGATVSGAGQVSIPNNKNTITVAVKAKNGNIQNYTINVEKTDGDDISISDLIQSTKIAQSGNYFILKAGYTLTNITDEVKGVSSLVNVKKNNDNNKLVTGDVVTLSNSTGTQEFNVVIKGDPTGDGNINIQDLLRIQKNILGYTELNGSYEKAADTNQDGRVDILDLLRVQKHILGYTTIG